MSSIFFKRKLSGRDYRIKVFRFAKRCQITLQDIITSSTWKGNFEMACIERMTQKTGRFMPYEMFFSLLLSSLRQSNNEAQLAVMTFRDLQNLFKEEVRQDVARQMDAENRRYLILTTRQPMITHYPLPLLSSPEPDMELMAMTKQEMQTNVTSVEPSSPKCSTPRSTPGVKRIMKRKDRTAAPEKGRSRRISFGKGDFLERVMGEHVEKVLNESFGSGTCDQERETIASLKLELKEQAREYKREMARLRRDNERLRRRIEEMKIREMEMSADIVRLTERQRLNVPEALGGRGGGRLQRARSASPGQQLRRRHGSASSISLRSYSPRPVRSMFNFFNTDDAASSRRRGSAERRRSSPAVRQVSSELDRRLTAQMRSKSLDDARHSERYLCAPGRRCYRDPYHPEYDSGVEASSGRRRGDRLVDEGDWRTFGDTPRPRSGWRSFDPTQYVEDRREALRQRSLERELLSRRPSARVSRLRPRRKANAAKRPSTDQAKPPPAEEAWTEVGDSAVVGMRQLESRLKNLQRMLSEKVN